MIRGVSFIMVILGLVFLLVLFVSEAKVIEDIRNLEINTKVVLEGVVDGERLLGNFNILNINGIDVVCECRESYKGSEIIVEGVIEEYDNKKQVRVLEIKLSD
tara:strand:- start:62 stop:370 length:309 start_codon:yes stop_codon:yes gene_type:complete